MNLIKCMHTENDCYKTNEVVTPVGIVVHSTGANNTTIKRYSQPSANDPNRSQLLSLIGTNSYNNHWNKSGVQKAVHYFVGKIADGTVATVQNLPETIACWGVGRGSKGSYNYAPTAHIQFEICEDNLTTASYYDAVMNEAMDLCKDICLRWGWNADVIVSHREACKLGYGSNHSDIDHWLSKMGHDMNYFRSCVQSRIDAAKKPVEVAPAEPENKVDESYVPTVGEVVYYAGTIHYSSSNSTSPSKCNPGEATCTRTYNGRHPYHLVRTSGDKAGVYGWVDAEFIRKIEKQPEVEKEPEVETPVTPEPEEPVVEPEIKEEVKDTPVVEPETPVVPEPENTQPEEVEPTPVEPEPEVIQPQPSNPTDPDPVEPQPVEPKKGFWKQLIEYIFNILKTIFSK